MINRQEAERKSSEHAGHASNGDEREGQEERRQAGEAHDRAREAGHRRVMPTPITRSSTAQRMASEPALDLDTASGLSSGIGDEESKQCMIEIRAATSELKEEIGLPHLYSFHTTLRALEIVAATVVLVLLPTTINRL